MRKNKKFHNLSILKITQIAHFYILTKSTPLFIMRNLEIRVHSPRLLFRNKKTVFFVQTQFIFIMRKVEIRVHSPELTFGLNSEQRYTRYLLKSVFIIHVQGTIDFFFNFENFWLQEKFLKNSKKIIYGFCIFFSKEWTWT